MSRTILGAQETNWTQGSDILVPRANTSRMSEIMICRICMFM